MADAHRRALRRVLKWTWVAGIVAAAAWVLARSWPQAEAALRSMPPSMLLGSVALTGLAKFALGENARIAADRCGIPLRYGQALRLYNASQLGKYLPGSVWQFIGRAAAYRTRGAGFGAIRDALLIESGWVVASAFAVGLLLAGAGAPGLVERIAPGALQSPWWRFGLALVSVAMLGLLAWKRMLLRRYAALARPSAWLVVVLAATWVLLGLSFWVLAHAAGMAAPAPYAIGLFALAFALGFMVPFAPAGLGVRDGILTLGLLPYGPLEQAVVVTLVARLVYLVTELGLAGAQELVATLWTARGRGRNA